jgi:DNA modification methylase
MTDAIRTLLERAENERNKKLVELTTKKGPDQFLNTPLGKGHVPTPSTVKQKTAEELDAELFGTPPPVVGIFSSAVQSTSQSNDELPPDMGTPTSTPVPAKGPVIALTSSFFNLDGAHALIKLGHESVDHIICDLPYGIDMDLIAQDNGGQDIEHTREGHIVENNIDFWKRLIPSAYDAIRDGGYFIAFYDLEFHNLLTDLGRNAGFKVQRWPLVWNKTHRCVNKSANVNFTKSHEVAFVFRKGKATLLQPQDRSVWTGSNEAEAKALGHTFAKPFKLWQWLYDAVCQRGQTTFDPCVGRGSSTIAALERGLRPMGSELLTDDYNALLVNLQNWYKLKDPTVTFE